MVVKKIFALISVLAFLAVATLFTPSTASARNLQYKPGDGEIEAYVNAGEPTEIRFPGPIAGGFKNSNAAIALEKKDSSLIVFGKEGIADNGEALLVKLKDGRSFPLRIRRASSDNPRDPQLSIEDPDGGLDLGGEEEEPKPSDERSYSYAPPSKVSGLMREMTLVSEFGKRKISGYQISEKYKGQTVVNDGTVVAKVDKIFIGPNLWGYVLDATNLLDQTQKVNPASFRIDGTRAVSVSNWELAPRPMNVEEQISGKHNAKVYVITRAR